MKIYVNIYSFSYDSVFGRAYATRKLAKEDECRANEEIFDFSFSLEEFPQINRFLKLCIGAYSVIAECRELNIAKEDIVIYDCDFDGEDVKKELLKLIKQNYDVNFGKWMEKRSAYERLS